jgi:hypothetical protein
LSILSIWIAYSFDIVQVDLSKIANNPYGEYFRGSFSSDFRLKQEKFSSVEH